MKKSEYKPKVFKSRHALVLYIIAVLFFLLWSLGPILWSFIISITPENEMMSSPANFFPNHPTFSNYVQLFNSQGDMGSTFLPGMINTLVITISTIVISMPVSVFGAYAFSRMKFKGNKFVYYALIGTLVIPVFACVIPLFKIYSNLNLINNPIALILVYVSAVLPLAVWLMSSYFSSLPRELEEAAAIDGCGPFMTIIKIILPVSYPVMLASTLIIFVTTWNQFLIPLILSPSQSTKPIAVVISEFVTKVTTNYGLMNAGGILAIVPPCVIAVIFRKSLTYGLAGSTKG